MQHQGTFWFVTQTKLCSCLKIQLSIHVWRDIKLQIICQLIPQPVAKMENGVHHPSVVVNFFSLSLPLFFFSPPVAFLILSVGCPLYIKIFFSLQKSNVLCCSWEMGISLPRRVNTAVELLWNLPVQETTKGWDLPLLSATTLDGLHHHQCAKVILLQYWNSAGKGLAQNINQVVYFNVWREFYCSKLH